jgi:DNA-binding PadR family transcriptional regulator
MTASTRCHSAVYSGHVSKTSRPDKRGRADLELFILALISRGLSTPYDLHASAGLSPGATIPALGRLETAGFVTKGEEAARRRLEYQLTARGKKHLESSWRVLLDSPPNSDLDSILRVASLALLMGEKKQTVSAYLTDASKRREAKAATVKIADAPKLREIGLYPWFRQFGEPTRTAAEAAILKKIASIVKKTRN